MTKPKVNKNVYILGAGFSADAGMPLLDGFLDQLREVYANPAYVTDDDEKEHLREVLKFRKEISTCSDKTCIDLDNIEHLFSLAAMQAINNKDKYKLMTNIPWAIATTLDRIEQIKWNIRLQFDKNKQGPLRIGNTMTKLERSSSHSLCHFDLYEFAAGILSGEFSTDIEQENVFVTFNYDLVLENALRAIGVKSDYCLSNTVDNRNTSNLSSTAEVVKLHGSINWTQSNTSSNSSMETTKVEIWDSYRDIPKDRELLLSPPTWKKDPSVHYAQLWKRAADHISEAWRICVIGYSAPLTDPYFIYLLGLGLSNNSDLYKFTVIDPSVGTIEEPGTVGKSYHELLNAKLIGRRFSPVNTMFRDAMSRPDVWEKNLNRKGEFLSSLQACAVHKA